MKRMILLFSTIILEQGAPAVHFDRLLTVDHNLELAAR